MERNDTQQPDSKPTVSADVFADPKLQHNPNRAHRISIDAATEERAGEQGIAAFIPLRELKKAKRGSTAQRRAIGFALEIAFTHPNGGTYTLTSPWVTITPR